MHGKQARKSGEFPECYSFSLFTSISLVFLSCRQVSNEARDLLTFPSSPLAIPSHLLLSFTLDLLKLPRTWNCFCFECDILERFGLRSRHVLLQMDRGVFLCVGYVGKCCVCDLLASCIYDLFYLLMFGLWLPY